MLPIAFALTVPSALASLGVPQTLEHLVIVSLLTLYTGQLEFFSFF
jgi:hypothetical protein